MKTIYAAIAGLTILAAPAAVWAADEAQTGDAKGGHHQKMWDKLDANHDGQVTADEIKMAADARFKKLDKNGDGVITPDEQPQLFDNPDINGDGKITPDEVETRAAAKMKKMDANGDGIITVAERDAAKAQWKAKHDQDKDAPAAPATPQ